MHFHRYFSDSVHLPNYHALMAFPQGLFQMADGSPIKTMCLEGCILKRPLSLRIHLITTTGGPGVTYRVGVQPAPSHRCAVSQGPCLVPRADREGRWWTAPPSTASPTSSSSCCLHLTREGSCSSWPLFAVMATGKGKTPVSEGGKREKN